MRRPPAVAGVFYPADPEQLRQAMASLIDRDADRRPARAVLVPHAGYVYSGGCAGKTYSAVELPRRFVILCPNHTGLGPAIATDDTAQWDTPLGPAAVDRDLVERLIRACPAVVPDANAHMREHALEVQLPFLQSLCAEDFSFAPVCVGTGRLEVLQELGAGLAELLNACDPSPMLVISSDMTHYESATSARLKDRKALACLERVDAPALHRVVRRENISMCGASPAVAALTALSSCGVERGHLVEYTHSGVVTGDEREVVAYAGMVFA